MAKRTRVTTSVSTLVTDLNYLSDIARIANRKDFKASIAEIQPRLEKFTAEYVSLKNEIAALKRVMLNQEEEVEEEVEA